ncbi:MAG: LysR family transcriptional regulator, partial [Caulobacteraceae bacterium]
FEPVLGQPGPQIASILALVAANLGVTLVPESASQLALAGVVYKALRTPRLVHLALAHRRSEASAPVHNFVRLARSWVAA